MAKEVYTVSTEGFGAHNEIRNYELNIDGTGENAPDTLETLLAAYATCFVPALRVGAEQRDAGDLGEIEIDVTGELNDDDKLESIHFDITTEADMDEDTASRVVDRALALCKVHDALKQSLYADIDI